MSRNTPISSIPKSGTSAGNVNFNFVDNASLQNEILANSSSDGTNKSSACLAIKNYVAPTLEPNLNNISIDNDYDIVSYFLISKELSDILEIQFVKKLFCTWQKF